MQKGLTDNVFKACLSSGDYMQIKNALQLLIRCVKVRGSRARSAARCAQQEHGS